jgi:N-acetyl-gamma-glutamyl-phosphate reductase
MSDKKKIAVVGATGYTGQELVRILLGHPSVEIVALTSRKGHGKDYTRLFPQLAGYELPAVSAYKPKKTAKPADLVFFCLPHAESQTAVADAVDLGKKSVDLSADFRLRKVSDYQRWYGKHKRPDLVKKAVYGLPEIHRSRIKRAVLVANPGCYPTGVILGAAPFLEAGAADPSRIIADMKSGVSGAGRKASIELSFCELNEGLRPYKLYAHRHAPEMTQELSRAAGKKVGVTFSPHLAPMNRGILGTIYLRLNKKCSADYLQGILVKAYGSEPFVRVLEQGEMPCVSRVRVANFVDVAVTASPDGREAIVTTALDNLVKGASGAAVQNMNLMLGLPETEGLLAAPTRP